jgi:hypothetical protein
LYSRNLNAPLDVWSSGVSMVCRNWTQATDFRETSVQQITAQVWE